MIDIDKSISTLVQDIQNILTAHNLSKNAVSEFSERLAARLIDRLGKREDTNTLRMSNYSTPDRKLWYTVNRPDLAESLEPEARLKFLYGDILEEFMIFLAQQQHNVQHIQREVSLYGVLGHIDCVIDGVVVDVKSANARSFSKFQHHSLGVDDPFGYLDQLSLYVYAAKDLPGVTVKKQGAFLAVDKELGKLVLDVYNIKEMDYEKETIRKRNILAESNPPQRCYEPVPEGTSGNLKLGVECSYCPFKKHCWSAANDGRGIRTFAYSKGPVHLVKVIREPDVLEIKNGV